LEVGVQLSDPEAFEQAPDEGVVQAADQLALPDGQSVERAVVEHDRVPGGPRLEAETRE
jgi:hypothetical protein